MEISAWANRCYILTPHQKRRFPEMVDFRTSAGFLGGRHERDAAHLHGGGPQAVVTDLGIMEPDVSGELVLTALHPGCTAEQARANTGWELKTAAELRLTEAPSEEELRILRQELDPQGIYLKGSA
jgi:glutaconate CoA-transferase subunit B